MLWFHGDDKLDAVITGLRWECAWLMGALDIFSTLAPSFAHVAVFLSDCLSSTCHSVHLLLFFNLLSMSLRPFDSSTRLHGDTWLTFIHINSIRSFRNYILCSFCARIGLRLWPSSLAYFPHAFTRSLHRYLCAPVYDSSGKFIGLVHNPYCLCRHVASMGGPRLGSVSAKAFSYNINLQHVTHFRSCLNSR